MQLELPRAFSLNPSTGCVAHGGFTSPLDHVRKVSIFVKEKYLSDFTTPENINLQKLRVWINVSIFKENYFQNTITSFNSVDSNMRINRKKVL